MAKKYLNAKLYFNKQLIQIIIKTAIVLYMDRAPGGCGLYILVVFDLKHLNIKFGMTRPPGLGVI